MELIQSTRRILKLPARWWHRHGFGIQSPNDYEFVRDVLFESLPYYAYSEQHLTKKSEQQLYRLRIYFSNNLLACITEGMPNSLDQYERAKAEATDESAIVIEHINGMNASLWQMVLVDPRARITFDMGSRGVVTFNTNRIKQNYIL